MLAKYPSLLFAIFLATLLVTAIFFSLFQKDYRIVQPQRGMYNVLLGVLWMGVKGSCCCLCFNMPKNKGSHWLDIARQKYSEEDVEDIKVVLRVLRVFM